MLSLPLLAQSPASPPPSATRTHVLALRQETRDERLDWLTTEEPLEIRVQGAGQAMLQVAVTLGCALHGQV